MLRSSLVPEVIPWKSKILALPSLSEIKDDMDHTVTFAAFNEGCPFHFHNLLYSKNVLLSVETQRILNQGMPKYGKPIKIRHIFLSEALADKMYIL